jgi:predicted nucleotidyltransferase
LHSELQIAVFTEDQRYLDEIHRGLQKVFNVSKYLDFPFTLDEVATYFLPGVQVAEEEVRDLITRGEFIDLPFQIRDGYLFAGAAKSTATRLEREQFSASKLRSAAEFATMLTRLAPFIRTIAVTGSVAYGSARKSDDIDLFIVTKPNRLWLSAFLALVLIRLSRLLHLRPSHLSQFCLSYVHDELGFANESKRSKSNMLFACELLKAQPVAGIRHYRRFLEQNSWINGVYSKAYPVKLKQLEQGEGAPKTANDNHTTLLSFLVGWAEGFAFAFLSRYLRLRAYLTNLELRSHGERFRIFEPRISAMSCVYTSNFYRWLQALWGDDSLQSHVE